MKLKLPFRLSNRLLPSLNVAGATLSLDKDNTFILDLPSGRPSWVGLPQYYTYVTNPNTRESYEDKFIDILDTLEMAGAQYEIGIHDKHIPIWALEWAKVNNAELEILRREIEDSTEDYFEYPA